VDWRYGRASILQRLYNRSQSIFAVLLSAPPGISVPSLMKESTSQPNPSKPTRSSIGCCGCARSEELPFALSRTLSCPVGILPEPRLPTRGGHLKKRHLDPRASELVCNESIDMVPVTHTRGTLRHSQGTPLKIFRLDLTCPYGDNFERLRPSAGVHRATPWICSKSKCPQIQGLRKYRGLTKSARVIITGRGYVEMNQMPPAPKVNVK
jgi:hypothetical protein